jgi:cell cycle sensor histidine kinase DivJ
LPFLAALALPAGRPTLGAGAAFGAAAFLALLQYAKALPAAPPMPAAALVGGVGVLAFLAGAAKAVADLANRSDEAEVERALMARFTAELPCLAVSLDRLGGIEAAYGSGLPGMDDAALDAGLIQAALPDDRSALRASLAEAMNRGAAETVFRPMGAPDRPIALRLRRSGPETLSAVLEPAKAAPVAQTFPLPTTVTVKPLVLNPVAVAPAADVAALEAQLAQAMEERDAALAAASARARFLANMSHELRTPLNAIMGFSDIMRSRLFGDLSQRYGDYAELIHESGRHLLDLINDVLDMSKIEADRYELALEEFDVREPVQAALRLVRLQADEAGVALRGVLPTDELLVEADRRAIRQTVLNLVSNALKFTPRGGQVTVSVAAAGDRELELTVADTGVGIAPDDLERLGQPYEQAGAAEQRSLGTGLGLSLVKALARLHGGSMAIESQVGEGAAVTVRLPILVQPAAAPEPPAPFEAEPPPPPPSFAPPEPELSKAEPVEAPAPSAEAKKPETRASGGAEVISLSLLRPNFGGDRGGPPPNVA